MEDAAVSSVGEGFNESNKSVHLPMDQATNGSVSAPD